MLGSSIATAGGNWSITSSPLANGAHSIAARATDVAGNVSAVSGTLTVTIQSTTFRVIAFSSNASGFDVVFNRAPNLTDLNLYDGLDLSVDVPDVILHANTANVDIHGSLAFNAATNTMSFVKTGDILAPDTYSVTLRSSLTGFHDLNGRLLDGNGNFIDTETGDNYVNSFTVTTSSARVLSVKDFARGPGQPVNDSPVIPNSQLAVSIDNADNLRSVDFKFQYDPALLHVTGATLASGIPSDWSITSNNSVAGQLIVSASGITALSGANVPLVLISADVPASAPYGAIEVLRLQNAAVALQAGQLVVPAAAIGDFAIHKATYLGDADGNGIYTFFDIALIARMVVGTDSGFDAAGWTDPVIVANVIGNGKLSGADTAVVAQKSVGLPTPQIPDLPGIPLQPNGGGSIALETAETATVYTSSHSITSVILAERIPEVEQGETFHGGGALIKLGGTGNEIDLAGNEGKWLISTTAIETSFQEPHARIAESTTTSDFPRTMASASGTDPGSQADSSLFLKVSGRKANLLDDRAVDILVGTDDWCFARRSASPGEPSGRF